jgi:uncharacterized protein (DUF488 family)
VNDGLNGILPRVILYTTSYEGRSLAQFLSSLQEHGVRVLVDVREAPISRKPGFSKTALAAALGDAGLTYLHMRALGCPKPIRDAYRYDGDWARYTVLFQRHLQRQGLALRELSDLAAEQPAAVMCYEADFNRCHRTYVARAVAGRLGASVGHITAGGLVIEAAGASRAAGRSR